MVILSPVFVHAEHFHKHIGFTMLALDIQKVKEYGVNGEAAM